MAAGPLVFQAIEEIFYSNNCKPPDLPYLPEWCGAPPIAFHIVLLSTLIGPWLVATYLLARGEAIVQFDSGYTYGWFAFVFMGLMWWLGFLAFFVLLFYWEGAGQRPGFLVFAVVGGAIAVPVIGFLTASAVPACRG